jgi:hypothetical protein
MKTIPFTFEGKDYEIRVVTDGMTTYVRTFRDGVPANGYSYQVSFPVAFDMQKQLGLSALDELVETAKRDITEKNWERLLKAIKETEEYEREHPGSTESKA